MTETRDAKCPGCGEVVQVALCDPADGAAALLNRIDLWCDACFAREKRRKDQQELARQLQMRTSDLIRARLLPENFREYRFRDALPDVQRRYPHEVRQAAEWDGQGVLYLAGPHGTGKTSLARCVLRKLFVHKLDAAEVSARDLIWRATRFGDEYWFRDVIRKPVLLIDDLDKVEVDEKRLEALWEVFDKRLGKSTILTANVALGGVAKLWQGKAGRNSSLVSATLDRFNPVTEIVIKGESLRKGKD